MERDRWDGPVVLCCDGPIGNEKHCFRLRACLENGRPASLWPSIWAAAQPAHSITSLAISDAEGQQHVAGLAEEFAVTRVYEQHTVGDRRPAGI
jgi:hypothetical protein